MDDVLEISRELSKEEIANIFNKAKNLSKKEIEELGFKYRDDVLSKADSILYLVADYKMSIEEAEDQYLFGKQEMGKVRNNIA